MYAWQRVPRFLCGMSLGAADKSEPQAHGDENRLLSSVSRSPVRLGLSDDLTVRIGRSRAHPRKAPSGCSD